MCIVRLTHQQLECHHEDAALNDKRAQLERKMDRRYGRQQAAPPRPSPLRKGGDIRGVMKAESTRCCTPLLASLNSELGVVLRRLLIRERRRERLSASPDIHSPQTKPLGRLSPLAPAASLHTT